MGAGYHTAEAPITMLNGLKVCVVLPALNAAATLQRTLSEVPRDVVDDVILVDDGSRDGTADLARQLGIHTLVHASTRGYGANQKTCYREALLRGADIVVMLHPDYQYSPRLVPALASCIASGHFEVALGSRILGGKALGGGMPLWRFASNRVLTLIDNLVLGSKLSEFHTGFRAFSRRALETLPLAENSDAFAFDHEVLLQVLWQGWGIAEVSCPTRYSSDSSSISFGAALRYGASSLWGTARWRLARWGLCKPALLSPRGRRLLDSQATPPATKAPVTASLS
jgi:glycosyltransferase involved in cell wall biosynthesis